MAHMIDEPIKSPMEPSKPFVPTDSTIGAILSRKTSYVSPTEGELAILSQYIEQLLKDGQGESIVELGSGEGVSPGLTVEEMEASRNTLKSIAQQLNADCVLLRERQLAAGRVGEFLLRFKPDDTDFMEIKVAVVGNVDAGKSTLLGVLTHGELDDGRGLARQRLFRHKHEKETGRTSSVSNDILGFDSTGQVVNRPVHGALDWIRICEQSAKVITFIDLAGHERYLKTTVFGMTGHAPNFAMLMIGSNAGIIGMTKEHLGLALALSVPVFVVVTKVDMCPSNVLDETMRLLVRILKSPGCRKIPVIVSSADDVVCTATNFTSERVCPIFKVSNVTGDNLDLLKMFLNLLNSHGDPKIAEPSEFQIDDTFSVPGVGTVVSGTCLQGIIRLNDPLLLGPDAVGKFSLLPIKSIHRKRMPVRMVRGGQTASFALKKVKRSQIRKGMVLISPHLEPVACWEFGADVLILHHPTTISVKYQAMVHVGPIRQTATIIEMSKEHLRTGDKADVRFRFIKNPEYLRNGMRLVFREGKTKAVGKITKVFPHVSAVAQNTRQRSQKKEQLAAQHHHHPPQKSSKRARRHENNTCRISESNSTTNGEVGACGGPVVTSDRSAEIESAPSIQCSEAAMTES